MVIHLTLLPYLRVTGELKTKPTQHSVKTMLESGVQPDVLVCRSEHAIDDDIRRKLALFTNVRQKNVIESRDANTIYEVPIMMFKKLDEVVLDYLIFRKTLLQIWTNGVNSCQDCSIQSALLRLV